VRTNFLREAISPFYACPSERRGKPCTGGRCGNPGSLTLNSPGPNPELALWICRTFRRPARASLVATVRLKSGLLFTGASRTDCSAGRSRCLQTADYPLTNQCVVGLYRRAAKQLDRADGKCHPRGRDPRPLFRLCADAGPRHVRGDRQPCRSVAETISRLLSAFAQGMLVNVRFASRPDDRATPSMSTSMPHLRRNYAEAARLSK